MQFLQLVIDELYKYLPNNWQQVALYCSKYNSLCQTKFFVDIGNGYIDCYNLGIDKYELYDLFERISKIIMAERDKLPKRKRWSIMTATINSIGKFSMDFDYSDLTDSFVDKSLQWEKQLLNKQ